MGRAHQRDLRVEIIPERVPDDEMVDIIIRALWGSKQSAAREFLAWEAKKIKEEGYAEPNQLDNKYQPTATV